MKTIIAAGVATFFAIAASTVPAQAGGGITFGFGGGHGGHHGGHHGHHGGGVYLGFTPTVVAPERNHWRKHVRWCFNHYSSYDPGSNTFMTVRGPRYCDSPFM